MTKNESERFAQLDNASIFSIGVKVPMFFLKKFCYLLLIDKVPLEGFRIVTKVKKKIFTLLLILQVFLHFYVQ